VNEYLFNVNRERGRKPAWWQAAPDFLPSVALVIALALSLCSCANNTPSDAAIASQARREAELSAAAESNRENPFKGHYAF
jgi:hypothetical protein